MYFEVPNHHSKSTFLGIDILERRSANLLAEDFPFPGSDVATIASSRNYSDPSESDYMTPTQFQLQYTLSC